MNNASNQPGVARTSSKLRIAVVGGGPSGSTLAALLADRGFSVTMFDDGRRPEMIVGESLIPAVVPIFQRLGIEQKVAETGVVKPGVSFLFGEDEGIHFNFLPVAGRLPTYAYNVHRPQFDDVLLNRAIEAGVAHVPLRARLQKRTDKDAGTNEILLSPETLAAAPSLYGRQPDLIVDASGRVRTIAKLLEIPSKVGPRKDVAHFAHYEGFDPITPEGQVIIGRMASGWSWRIPLRDRLSVGIVLNRDDAAMLGKTAEERLERAILCDHDLSAAKGTFKRISPVATYTNYQLVSERGHGAGWVLAGDAFGFVDPMLSSGMFIALRSAEWLADEIIAADARGAGSLPDFTKYSLEMHRLIMAWMELVGHWYSGGVFTFHRAGMARLKAHNHFFNRMMRRHVERNLACMATGASTTSAYSRGMLRFMTTHGLSGMDPAMLSIR